MALSTTSAYTPQEEQFGGVSTGRLLAWGPVYPLASGYICRIRSYVISSLSSAGTKVKWGHQDARCSPDRREGDPRTPSAARYSTTLQGVVPMPA